MKYEFCNGCDRRIAVVLFTKGRCRGCHKDAHERKERRERGFMKVEDEFMGE